MTLTDQQHAALLRILPYLDLLPVSVAALVVGALKAYREVNGLKGEAGHE